MKKILNREGTKGAKEDLNILPFTSKFGLFSFAFPCALRAFVVKGVFHVFG
jgi:hypothetical protein